MKDLIILIDNGHGNPPRTGGKCSPDGRLKEYVWAREIAKRLQVTLIKDGYTAILVTPEDSDISLTERVRRVNNYCTKYGTSKCVLVSIHINAASADGKWHDACGWSGWVSPKASNNSKKFAQLLYDEAAKRGLQGNRYVPPCKYWTGDFSIVSNTKCPAVLTENLFQDNLKDCDYLLSEVGKQTIVDLHKDAIIKYAQQL